MADIFPQKAVFTSKYHVEIDLLQVIRPDFEQRPTAGSRQTLILPNNASAMEVKVTVTYLKEQSVQFRSHPLYRPDMTPYSFWLLFPPKQILSVGNFLVAKDFEKAPKSHTDTMPKSEYRNPLDSRLRRRTLCMGKEEKLF